MAWYPYFTEFYIEIPSQHKKSDFEIALQIIGSILWHYGYEMNFESDDDTKHIFNANAIVNYIIKNFVTHNDDFEFMINANLIKDDQIYKNKQILDDMIDNINLCAYGGFYPTNNNTIFTNFDISNVNPSAKIFNKVIENCKQYISYKNYGYANYNIIEEYMDALVKNNKGKLTCDVDVGAPFVGVNIQKLSINMVRKNIAK